MRHQVIFRDAGLAAAAIVLGVISALALADAVIVHQINRAWPPVSMAQRHAEAVTHAAAGLDAFVDEATAIVRVSEADIVAPVLRRLEALQPISFDKGSVALSQTTAAFAPQGIRLSTAFILSIPSLDLRVMGRATGTGFVALNGARAEVRPAFDSIEVQRLESTGWRWLLHPVVVPVNVLLRAFIDNVNGALPVIVKELPVSPLHLPGTPPVAIPVTVAGRTIMLTPPTLQAASGLIEPGSLYILAELRSREAPAKPTAPAVTDYELFRARFHAAARALTMEGDTSYARLSDSFVRQYLAGYVPPVPGADRQRDMIARARRQLDGIRGPDLAVNVAIADIRTTLLARARKELDKLQEGKRFSFDDPTLVFGGQAARAALVVTGAIGGGATTLTGRVRISGIASVGGDPAGIALAPLLAGAEILDATLTGSAIDLTGVVAGLNGVIAAAIDSVNGAITPIVVAVPQPPVAKIKLAPDPARAPGLTVTPAEISPGLPQWERLAILVDSQRLYAVVDWTATGLPARPEPVAHPPSPPGSVDDAFEDYRRLYLEVWAKAFGDTASATTVASAFARTARLAEYLNYAWAAAGVSLTYDKPFAVDGFGPETVHIIKRTDAHCSHKNCDFHCGSAWSLKGQACRVREHACRIADVAVYAACQAYVKVLNPVFYALGSLGTISGSGSGRAGIKLQRTALAFAPDLRTVTFSADAGAVASADIHAKFSPLSAVLVGCFGGPVNVSGSGVAPVQRQALGVRLTSVTSLPRPPNGQALALHFETDPMHVKGHTTTPPLAELLVDNPQLLITCPIGVHLGFAGLTVGQIVGNGPEALRKAIKKKAPRVYEILTGEIDETVGPWSKDVTIEPIAMTVAERVLSLSASFGQNYVRFDAQ